MPTTDARQHVPDRSQVHRVIGTECFRCLTCTEKGAQPFHPCDEDCWTEGPLDASTTRPAVDVGTPCSCGARGRPFYLPLTEKVESITHHFDGTPCMGEIELDAVREHMGDAVHEAFDRVVAENTQRRATAVEAIVGLAKHLGASHVDIGWPSATVPDVTRYVVNEDQHGAFGTLDLQPGEAAHLGRLGIALDHIAHCSKCDQGQLVDVTQRPRAGTDTICRCSCHVNEAQPFAWDHPSSHVTDDWHRFTVDERWAVIDTTGAETLDYDDLVAALQATPEEGVRTCRVCGCTDSKPCELPATEYEGLMTCSWISPERNICTACVNKWADDIVAAEHTSDHLPGLEIQAEPWHYRWNGVHRPKRCVLCRLEWLTVRLGLAHYAPDGADDNGQLDRLWQSWSMHNLVAHPISELLHLGDLGDLGNRIHDATLPTHEAGTGRG